MALWYAATTASPAAEFIEPPLNLESIAKEIISIPSTVPLATTTAQW